MTIKRPTSGWKLQRVTTHPGEMLKEEFLLPLGITQNALAMKLRVPAGSHAGHRSAPRAFLRQ